MLWDKVEKDTSVEFLSKKLVLNLDTTNLTVDPALAVVGGSSKDADEAQPTRPKRKLHQCTMCILGTTMALWSKAEIQKYTFWWEKNIFEAIFPMLF